jgi:murein hydrolase activator
MKPARFASPMVGYCLVAALIGASLTGGHPAHGQSQNQASSRQAGALAAEVRDRLRLIRQELIETARNAQARETVVNQAEQRLGILKARHTARAGELAGLRDRLASLTAAMQRLARRPPEAILTSPQPPLETARAMMLVRFLVPGIKSEADLIRDELTALETLNHQIQIEQRRFHAANQALEERRDQLDLLIEQKNALWVIMSKTTKPSDAQTDQLAESAATLAELLAALKKHGEAQAIASGRLKSFIEAAPKPDLGTDPKAARPSPESTRPSEQTAVAPSPPSAPSPEARTPPVPAAGSFTANKGRLTFPAIGRLVGRFGETDEVGLTAKGITVQTRPNAPVVAAHDGKVIYSGPFRGYGRIIIIEHGHGFLTLLAGLDRIDVQAGQGLLAGEPVGTMRGADEIGDARSRHLYIELRQDGAPVDPLAWLSTQRDTATQ